MQKYLSKLLKPRSFERDYNSKLNLHVKPETLAQSDVLNTVEECYLVAEEFFSRRFSRPEVNFKLRGKSAGTAHPTLNKLRFNRVLLEENHRAFVDEVVPHEVCHLLCHQLYGKVRPHGKEWQSLMRSLYQIPANTTHSFNTHSVAGQFFDYQCHCGLVKLSLRRHNKVLRGKSEYLCRQCRQKLTPKFPQDDPQDLI